MDFLPPTAPCLVFERETYTPYANNLRKTLDLVYYNYWVYCFILRMITYNCAHLKTVIYVNLCISAARIGFKVDATVTGQLLKYSYIINILQIQRLKTYFELAYVYV